jgi:HK97 family phage major capsid protein
MADSAAVVEQRDLLHGKQKILSEVLEAAGKDLDFSRKPVLEKLGATDAADANLKFQSMTREVNDIGAELVRIRTKEAAARVREIGEELRRPEEFTHADASVALSRKSWGHQVVESKEFKHSVATKTDMPVYLDMDLKTLMTTSAGFAIENVRSGLLVEKATRPIQALDLIPSFPISQSSFVYMEETTRTPGAAEGLEASTYNESVFVWTQRSSVVQKITDSIPVTDEQLEDAEQVASLLNQRLAFGVRQRLDQQILVGNGTSPNLRGMINVASIQTQAKGADNYIVAFMKALTLLRYTGRCTPSGAIYHPTDWQSTMLTQNANGDFLFGNPFQGAGPSSLFGIPVALSDALSQGTAIVADLANFTRIDNRRGVNVMTGYTGTQFTEGKVTIRADLRAAFTVTRAAAICTITGL